MLGVREAADVDGQPHLALAWSGRLCPAFLFSERPPVELQILRREPECVVAAVTCPQLDKAEPCHPPTIRSRVRKDHVLKRDDDCEWECRSTFGRRPQSLRLC